MNEETPWTPHRNGRARYCYDDAGDVVPLDDGPREEPLYGWDEDDEDDDG